MNKADLPRVVAQARRATTRLSDEGLKAWDSSYDWQSPLGGGVAGPRGKGGHADPVGMAAVAAILGKAPESMQYHAALIKVLDAKYQADQALVALLREIAPADPAKIQRGRVNLVPTCLVCTEPTITPRRGMCDADYRAWKRAGMPDLTTFKRSRQQQEAS